MQERRWRIFSASCYKHEGREKLIATPALNTDKLFVICLAAGCNGDKALRS